MSESQNRVTAHEEMIIKQTRAVNAFKGNLAKAITLMSNIPVVLSWQHNETEVEAARRLITDCAQALQALLDEAALGSFVANSLNIGSPYLMRLRAGFPLIDKLLSEALKDAPDKK